MLTSHQILVDAISRICCSTLSLKSRVNLALIPVIDFVFPSSSLIPFHCHLHQPSPLPPIPRTHSPFLSHSHQISLHAVLPSQSQSSSSTLHYECIRSLHHSFHSPSILSTCPAHFNQLLTSFLLRLSLTPIPPSAPPFFTCLFFSLLQFVSPGYSRKLAVSLVIFLLSPWSLSCIGILVLCMS